MNDISLLNKINSLPEELKKEVIHFVEFLQTKTEKKSEKKPRVFGSLKGKIHMADDFDKPIETMKKSEKKAGREFVNKWAGFLNSKDTDASKFDYLSEKYR